MVLLVGLLSICSFVLFGCTHTPQLWLFSHTPSISYPATEPIPIYFANEGEIEFKVDYYEALSFYELAPFRDHVAGKLSQEHLLIETPKAGKKGFVYEIDNPFRVVQDSSEAVLIVTMGVQEFDYGQLLSSNEKLARYVALGVLGLMKDKSKRAVFMAECWVDGNEAGNKIDQFQVAAISEDTTDKRLAMQQALEIAASDFLNKLLRPN